MGQAPPPNDYRLLAKQSEVSNDAPTKHHLDRRAHKLVDEDAGASDDDLLTTLEVATWLGISTQWLEIGRMKGYGPQFTRVAPRSIRYTRGNVRKYLKSRTHASTAEYSETAA